ncbi:glycosyltransferase 61 family protein [Aestuariivirga sp.]|uniref:glycosyltransferase 61 family protein n=1 Tax=Aestuariivirga sp. TaxID=2650926 RepID=UPI0035937AE8
MDAISLVDWSSHEHTVKHQLESGNPVLAIETLATWARDQVAKTNRTSDGGMSELEQSCQYFADHLSRKHAPTNVTNIGFDRPANVYVVTEIYQSGGHRRLLEMMIKSRPTERHLVLFSGLQEANRDYSVKRLTDIGVTALYPNRRLALFDRLVWLYGKLSALAARRVILLHHPGDVISAIAAYATAPVYGRRFYFVRHADTVATTCTRLQGITHLAIRPEQRDRILANMPDSRVLTLPLVYDPELAPSETLSELMEWIKSGNREFYSSGSFLTATCGGDHKFAVDGPVNFPDVVAGLLQNTRGRHIHIGNVSQMFTAAVHEAMDKVRIPRDRIRFVGEVASVASCLLQVKADLFVSSFPVGGGLSMSEAAYAGLPVAVYQPPGNPLASAAERVADHGFAGYIAGTTHRPPEAITWSEPIDLFRTLKGGLDDEVLHKLSRSSRAWYLAHFTPKKFTKRFNAIVMATEGRRREPLDMRRAETIKAIFDKAYYLSLYPDVAEAGIDPFVHYLRNGEAERRRPHPLFDPTHYLNQLPEPEKRFAKHRSLTHYLSRGEVLGFSPHPLFDPEYCRRSLKTIGIVSQSDQEEQASVLELYLQNGQTVSPHTLFDPAYYRSALPLGAGEDALLVHFVLRGADEGHNPHPLVDMSRIVAGRLSRLKALLGYVQGPAPSANEPQPHPLFNPSFFCGNSVNSWTSVAPNLLWAYLIEGNSAERSPHPLLSADCVERYRPGTLVDTETVLSLIVDGRYAGDTHPLVDANFVRQQAPWLERSITHPVLYFLAQGIVHNIDPHPWFSLQYYLRHYHTEISGHTNPLVYYLREGQARGHHPHPFFDPTTYAKRVPSERAQAAPLLDYLEQGAAGAIATVPLSDDLGRLYRKSAKEFMRADAADSAVSMFKESIHPSNAPPHPTLVVEHRPFSAQLIASETYEGPVFGTETGLADQAIKDVHLVFSGVEVRVDRPNVVSTHHIAPPSGSYWAPEGAARRWHNVTVVGGSDGFITSDGVWLDPTLTGCAPPDDGAREYGPVIALNILEVLLFRQNGHGAFESGILATGANSRNYFHFLFDLATRIRLADEMAPPEVPLLTDADMPGQFYQALRLLFPLRQVLRLSRSVSYSIRDLYAGSSQTLVRDRLDPVSSDQMRYHPLALRWLNDLGASARSEKNPKRVFFRHTGQFSKLLNGPEIAIELQKLGFTIVDCIYQSFYEQMRLAASADVIVGQDSNDLSNIVFARPGTEVYVLCSDAPGTNYYTWSIMGSILGLNVTNIVGWHAFGSAGGARPAVQDNFTIPLRLLSPFMELELTKHSETGFAADIDDMSSDPVRVFENLYAANDKAHVITSAWGLTAELTPEVFDKRLVALRRAARNGLLMTNSHVLQGLFGQEFFKNIGLSVRSGLATLDDHDDDELQTLFLLEQFLRTAQATTEGGSYVSVAAIPDVFGLGTEPHHDAFRRFLGLAMLYRQAFKLPLFVDLETVPDDVLGCYLNWLVAMPYPFRAGDDDAYRRFVPKLLDFLHDNLTLDRPEGIRNRVAQVASQLDLGQLFLLEGPLEDIWSHRNRLLEILALRDALPPERPETESVRPRRDRIRLGVLVRTFAKGPDSEAIIAFFKNFDRSRYELIAYSIGFRDRVVVADDEFSKLMANVFDRQVSLMDDKVRLRSKLLDDDLDLFILANATTYGIQKLDLALYHRVAARQIVLNSHVPMPTGFPSFDAYVTGLSDDLSCEVDQANYTEKLIRVKGPVINYLTAIKIREHGPLARQALGLSEDDVVLMNGGSMQKLRYDCLKTMMRVAKAIPMGKLMFAPYNPGWVSRSQAFAFNRQLKEMASEVGLPLTSIVVLGELSVKEAEGALMISDIYLNPFPHGGATMTHLALLQGVPPVTMRRRSTRSIDQFLIESHGFEELLVNDAEAYVALAADLGNNPERRKTLSAALLSAADNPPFVDNSEFSLDMQRVVDNIMRDASTK